MPTTFKNYVIAYIYNNKVKEIKNIFIKVDILIDILWYFIEILNILIIKKLIKKFKNRNSFTNLDKNTAINIAQLSILPG